MLKIFYKAIDERKIVEVTVDSSEKGMIVRRCIPFDYAISNRYKDGLSRYHFLTLDSPDGNHNLSILPMQLKDIKILVDSFDPATVITWKPNWTYRRDWGDKS